MNVAFVGHGFHLKYTKSSQFLTDLMRQVWPSMKVFAEEWSWARLPRRNWDLVVYFQQIPSRLLLEALDVKHAVLVPMYDDCPHDKEFWDQYRDCSIVCFSRTLADLLDGWGHRTFRTQYFPPVPDKPIDWSLGVQKAFFWPRKANLGWPLVKALLGDHPWKSVHLHVTEHQDLLTKGLTEEDARTFAITQTKWFLDRREMLDTLRSCQVYFAPRRTEGIGMSFLEAMAHGLAVVAADGATMNEYIVSGVNGYLYDPEAPVVPAYGQAAVWGSRARQTALEGRAQWEVSIPGLQRFLGEPGVPRGPGVWSPEAARKHRLVMMRYTVYLLAEPLRMLKRRVLSRATKEKR